MKEGDTSPSHYDKSELIKLPPFNDFIRKHGIESLDEVQCVIVERGVYQSVGKLPHKKQTIEDIQAKVKSIALKRKQKIIESREVKEKKGGSSGKETKEAAKTDLTDINQDELRAMLHNNKIELQQNMKELATEPEYFPWVI